MSNNYTVICLQIEATLHIWYEIFAIYLSVGQRKDLLTYTSNIYPMVTHEGNVSPHHVYILAVFTGMQQVLD